MPNGLECGMLNQVDRLGAWGAWFVVGGRLRHFVMVVMRLSDVLLLSQGFGVLVCQNVRVVFQYVRVTAFEVRLVEANMIG